jgi:hypothetical protein
MAPTQIWPSAPMFQKRILKASVTPRAETHRGMAILTVSRREMCCPARR